MYIKLILHVFVTIAWVRCSFCFELMKIIFRDIIAIFCAKLFFFYSVASQQLSPHQFPKTSTSIKVDVVLSKRYKFIAGHACIAKCKC